MKKLPSLDGWRAVSIGMVLLAHSLDTANFPTFLSSGVQRGKIINLGHLGVEFFFVISGFLITWLLLQEKKRTSDISLKNFYIRRILRIFPVYFFYLFTISLLKLEPLDAKRWLINATFNADFWPKTGLTRHFWSLGVEEKFYLLWPALLLLAIKNINNSKQLIRILCIPLVVAPLVRLFSSLEWCPASLDFIFQGGSFFGSFDCLAYGALAAVLFFYHQADLEIFLNSAPVLIICLALGACFLTGLFQPRIAENFFLALHGSMQGIGFALLLLQSVLFPHRMFFRWLNWRWISRIGVLSYSIYIWQEIFGCKTLFGHAGTRLLSFPFWIIMAIAAGHLSYYLLEKPFFKLRAYFRA